jgi:hypothetical protein
MAKERDEYGEVKTNKAGDREFQDEKTVIISGTNKTFANSQVKPDVDEQAEAEKTRPIWGKKKPTPDNKTENEVSVSKKQHKADQAPCVGWLVVWDGPGKGASHALQPGNNTIGRDNDCDVALSHGDDGISSDGKLSIDYEYRGHSFAFVNRGSKNTPYLNEKPIRTEQELQDGDKLLIGDTTLVFVPFCNQKRNWS